MNQDEALKLTYNFSSMTVASFIFRKIKYHGGFFFSKKKTKKN